MICEGLKCPEEQPIFSCLTISEVCKRVFGVVTFSEACGRILTINFSNFLGFRINLLRRLTMTNTDDVWSSFNFRSLPTLVCSQAQTVEYNDKREFIIATEA